VQETFFQLLGQMLDSPPEYTWITEALKAGLLRTIFKAGRRAAADHTEIKRLLRTTLPNAMVYHSVLSQLQISLEDAAIDGTMRRLQLSVRTEYNRFLKLASDRLNMKNWYDSPEYISRQACDNMDVRPMVFSLSTLLKLCFQVWQDLQPAGFPAVC
jgi:hypothetical protein